MLATSAISSLSVSWKTTGLNARPRSRASVSRRPITFSYSTIGPLSTSVPPHRGGHRPARGARLEESEEVPHRRPDRLQIDQVGEHRALAGAHRLLDKLAEPADAAAAGVHVAVAHQVEPAERLVEPFLRQVEVAGARLAVREHEQELVVLGHAVEQADRLLKAGADVRAAARFDAEELVPGLLLGHVLEDDVPPEVRRVAALQVVPEDEDRLADEREVLAAHRPGDVEHVHLDRPVVLEGRRVFDEVPGVLPHVDVVVDLARLARVAHQALQHRLFEVEIGAEADPVEVVELDLLLRLDLPGPPRVVERRQAQVVEQHLLGEADELIEVELDLKLFAVVVAAEEPAEGLDLVAARPRAGALAAGPAGAAALRQELALLAELQRRQVERRDLRLDLAVEDQLFLLDQLVQVLLEILPQQLIVLVLRDSSAVNAHGAPRPGLRLEAPADGPEEGARAGVAVAVLFDRAALQHVEQLAALRVHLLGLLVEAQAVLDLVEDDLVDRAAQVLVVLVAHLAQLVAALEQHVLERHAALAADLPLLHEDPLDLVEQLLVAVGQRLAEHAARGRVEVVEVQVLAVVVEVRRDDVLDQQLDLAVDELDLRLLEDLEQVFLVQVLDRLVGEGGLHRLGDHLEVDAAPGGRVPEREGVLEESRRQPAQTLRLGARLDRVGRRQLVDVLGHVLALAADAVGPVDEVAVDLHLARRVHVVRVVDLVDPAPQRLHDVLGQEHVVLRIVGVSDDHHIDVDGREVREVDPLRLDQLEQQRQQLPPALEDLGPVQDPAVGPDDLAFEVVGVRVVRRAALLQHREVDVADEVRDVFAAEIGRSVLGDADLVAGRDIDPQHRDFLPPAGPGDQPFAHRAGHGLLVPLEVFRLPHVDGDEVERVLVERAAVHGVYRAVGRLRVLLEPPLDLVHRHRLAGALRADQQQETPLHAHRVSFKERDDVVDLLVHAVNAFEHLGLAEIVDHVGDVVQRRAPEAPVRLALCDVVGYVCDRFHIRVTCFCTGPPRKLPEPASACLTSAL